MMKNPKPMRPILATEDQLEEIVLSDSHPKIICSSFWEKFYRAQEQGLTEFYEHQLILVAKEDRRYFARGDIEAKNPECLPVSDLDNEFGLKAGVIMQPYVLQDQVAVYSPNHDFWILARVVDHSDSDS